MDGTKCPVTLSRLGRMFGWMALTRTRGWAAALWSVPAIVLDHVCELNDVLAFFIFLAAFKGMFLGNTRKRKGAE